MKKSNAELFHAHRKFGTTVVNVRAAIIKEDGSGNGYVVQTVRDESGQLMTREVLPLHEVQESGLSLPTAWIK